MGPTSFITKCSQLNAPIIETSTINSTSMTMNSSSSMVIDSSSSMVIGGNSTSIGLGNNGAITTIYRGKADNQFLIQNANAITLVTTPFPNILINGIGAQDKNYLTYLDGVGLIWWSGNTLADNIICSYEAYSNPFTYGNDIGFIPLANDSTDYFNFIQQSNPDSLLTPLTMLPNTKRGAYFQTMSPLTNNGMVQTALLNVKNNGIPTTFYAGEVNAGDPIDVSALELTGSYYDYFIGFSMYAPINLTNMYCLFDPVFTSSGGIIQTITYSSQITLDPTQKVRWLLAPVTYGVSGVVENVFSFNGTIYCYPEGALPTTDWIVLLTAEFDTGTGQKGAIQCKEIIWDSEGGIGFNWEATAQVNNVYWLLLHKNYIPYV